MAGFRLGFWSGGAFCGEGLGYTDLFTVEIVGCGFFFVDVGIALIADEEVEVVKKGRMTFGTVWVEQMTLLAMRVSLSLRAARCLYWFTLIVLRGSRLDRRCLPVSIALYDIAI